LIARAKDDPRAFAMLYAAYVEPIFHHCYRRLGSREAAEDATSQVFTKAIAALPRFTPRDSAEGSFRGWLFTIANNVLADSFRAARPDRPLEHAVDVADTAPSPEDEALAADAGKGLREAMTHLPERERQVVELRLAGLTGPEIAQVLGCRANAVDVAQYRAVARLRTLLGVATNPIGGRNV
jgi:RNA polymerase sigma-70 factor (ECF subfamily)